MKNIRKEDCTMKQWKKMLLILMCAGAMSGLTGCGNNTDDNAVNEVEDGVEDGVDYIVDDLDPDDTEKNDTEKNDTGKNDTGKNDTDNTR